MCHLRSNYQERSFVALLIFGKRHLGDFEIAELQTLQHLVIAFEFCISALLLR